MCLRVFMIAVVVWLQPTTSAALECNIPHHKGAGILPFAVSPNGDVQLLLGFQKGRGWSSFGGGPKQVESINQPNRRCESRKETALREGVEELRFLIPRVEVKERLDNARSFPVNVKPSEFKTFVIHIGLIDIASYYSEPVLSRSGYTETSAIGWLSLRELVSLARKERDHINTPNGEQPWDIFLKGIRPELARDGSVEALFDHSTK